MAMEQLVPGSVHECMSLETKSRPYPTYIFFRRIH
jgi:hypothetical protein